VVVPLQAVLPRMTSLENLSCICSWLAYLVIGFAALCGNFGTRVGGWTTLGKIFAIVELPMVITLIVLYVIARIVLLVLPCIGLRALHPTAFVEIEWAAFFPHIG